MSKPILNQKSIIEPKGFMIQTKAIESGTIDSIPELPYMHQVTIFYLGKRNAEKEITFTINLN